MLRGKNMIIFNSSFNCSNNKKTYPIPFKSTSTEKIINGIKVVGNKTSFFRNDVNWDNLINYLIEKYKNETKVNIFNFACSDGSESYSIAIKLLNKLKDGASKFFPILAYDINEDVVKRANRYTIGLRDTDISAIEQNTSKRFKDYFILSDQKMNPPEETNIYEFIHYDVRDILKKTVTFNQLDMTRRASCLFPCNSVVFFRNVYPYLPIEEQEKLIGNLYKNLGKNSTVICGSFDLQLTYAAEYMEKIGFKPIDKGVFQPDFRPYKDRYIGAVYNKDHIPNHIVFENG